MARLLVGFGCAIRVHDPWLPASMLREAGVRPATLEDILASSDVLFVMAAVTSENEGFLGADAFAAMKPGSSLVLLSRAAAVDFDAFLDAIENGHIRAATDVYPVEPLPKDHRARHVEGLLHSAHRAGGMHGVFKQMGRMVLEDMALVDRNLPPLVCKRAERETAARMKSMPAGADRGERRGR
jgi:phosphoglycerate dehydrogenase-like enzyme